MIWDDLDVVTLILISSNITKTDGRRSWRSDPWWVLKRDITLEENVALDPSTAVRVSDSKGMVSFPLTVVKGGSGTYLLHFQPDVPDAKIVLETSAFKVENAMNITVVPSFSEIDIPEFGQVVSVPKLPQFCVRSSGNAVNLFAGTSGVHAPCLNLLDTDWYCELAQFLNCWQNFSGISFSSSTQGFDELG